jgi:hypothetical protein
MYPFIRWPLALVHTLTVVLLCRDSTLIMQLLRDNLTLWTSDMNDSEFATCPAYSVRQCY